MRTLVLASVAAPVVIALGIGAATLLSVRGGPESDRPWSADPAWTGGRTVTLSANIARSDVYRIPHGIDRGTCDMSAAESTAGRPVLVTGPGPGIAMDERDRACLDRSLEYAADRARVAWRSETSGHDFAFIAQRTFRSEAGAYCREFQSIVTIDSRRQTVTGIACRRTSGGWQMLN